MGMWPFVFEKLLSWVTVFAVILMGPWISFPTFIVIRTVIVKISVSGDQWVRLPQCQCSPESTMLIQVLAVAIRPVLLYSYTEHVEPCRCRLQLVTSRGDLL